MKMRKNILWGVICLLAAVALVVKKLGYLQGMGFWSLLFSVFLLGTLINGIVTKSWGKILFSAAFFIIVNDQRTDPMPVVTGAAKYPENIIEELSAKYKVIAIDAMDEALKMGNSRVFNVIILGVAAKHMDFPKEQWIEVIKKTVPPKTVDINVAAFEKGYDL